MTNPNTHPAPTMVYGGAPSFDDATAPNPFADLRAGLDVAKRLREHLPGDAPELQQADDTIAALEASIDAARPAPSAVVDLAAVERRDEPTPPTASSCRVDASYMTGPRTGCHLIPRPELEPLRAEIATLRADNDARGVLIEQLREKIVSMEANMRELMDESDKYMWERDEARQDLAKTLSALERANERADTVRSERDAAREELTDVLIELDRARMELAQTRRDRDKYFAAHNRTLRALNAALGEP